MAHFYIKPDLLEAVDWVAAEHENRYGKIVSAWQKHADACTFNIEVPTNSTASFYLPLDRYDITYRGKQVKIQHNTNIYQKDDNTYLRLYAGKHNIVFSAMKK